ncbi:unnamed protein product, partial [Lymnaea stagnalis]
NPLVSYVTYDNVLMVCLLFLGEIFAIFGIAANIINIAVFVRQGLSETINISFASLSASNIGALVTFQWYSVCVNPWFLRADIPFLPMDIQTLTAGYPHNYFSRVAGFITAFVAFERYLCVVVPLKVRRIITKRLTIVFNIGVYVVMVMNSFPVYYVSRFDWKFEPIANKSLYGLIYAPNRHNVMRVSYFITDFIVPFSAFFVVIFCTINLGVTLKTKAVWRKSVSRPVSTSGDDMGTKEQKVVLMITTVSVLFIVSFLPLSLLLVARAVVPDLGFGGKDLNLAVLLASVALLMETVNASVSSLVYFKMSTKFRVTLLAIFGLRRNFELAS